MMSGSHVPHQEYTNLDACFRPESLLVTERVMVRRPLAFNTFWLERISHFRFSTGNDLYHRFRYLHPIGYLATYPVVVTRREILSRFFPYAISVSSHCRDRSLFRSLDSSSDMDGFLSRRKQLLMRHRVAHRSPFPASHV